jgi:hypothetical protein
MYRQNWQFQLSSMHPSQSRRALRNDAGIRNEQPSEHVNDSIFRTSRPSKYTMASVDSVCEPDRDGVT